MQSNLVLSCITFPSNLNVKKGKLVKICKDLETAPLAYTVTIFCASRSSIDSLVIAQWALNSIRIYIPMNLI